MIKEKPMAFHITGIDFELYQQFKEVAKSKGYHIRAGQPYGKKLLAELKKDIVEMAMLNYILNKGELNETVPKM